MAFIPIYIAILFLIIIIDYIAAILIYKNEGKAKDYFLWISVLSTCLILFFFKYYNFASLNINWLSKFLGISYGLPILSIILPLGLSFHTFQSLSYVIEVYRGNQIPERHFGIYSLYVLFFPQLVAGPIERPQNILHQFYFPKKFDYEVVKSGAILLAWGLFKKVVIADRLAPFVDSFFSKPSEYNAISASMALIFFYFQIYCDFSGYTDIARGSARMLGFSLMKNFNIPFISSSLTEFWNRWHISLSSWLRDYLYEPLVMILRHLGLAGICAALFFTFFISGLWHGASWNFVIWGVLNGIFLMIEFLIRRILPKTKNQFIKKINKILGIFYTFTFICFTYIFFRASDLNNSYEIISIFIDTSKSLSFSNLLISNQTYEYFIVCTCFILCLIVIEVTLQSKEALDRFKAFPATVRIIFYQTLVLLTIIYGYWFSGITSFIYFQF